MNDNKASSYQDDKGPRLLLLGIRDRTPRNVDCSNARCIAHDSSRNTYYGTLVVEKGKSKRVIEWVRQNRYTTAHFTVMAAALGTVIHNAF